MSNTVLVTGASSGIGRATAHHFADAGWTVVATMRDVSAAGDLAEVDNVHVAPLDVLDHRSIGAAVDDVLDRMGQIDVLVNNAGYASFGPIEATPIDAFRRQFETNVVGLVAMAQAVLPSMRSRRSGVIVNISSPAGKIGFPLGSAYCGSKHAVEGISEAMSHELALVGVAVKIIEPGAIRTDFAPRSLELHADAVPGDYQPLVDATRASFATIDDTASPPEIVARVVFDAATDGSDRLRYTAGDDAVGMIEARATAGDEAFVRGLRARVTGSV